MDESAFDLAEQLAAAERLAAVNAAQRATAGQGQDDCEACGERIPPDRRRAAPFAIRCVDCQAALEHWRRVDRSPFCNLK